LALFQLLTVLQLDFAKSKAGQSLALFEGFWRLGQAIGRFDNSLKECSLNAERFFKDS